MGIYCMAMFKNGHMYGQGCYKITVVGRRYYVWCVHRVFSECNIKLHTILPHPPLPPNCREVLVNTRGC